MGQREASRAVTLLEIIVVVIIISILTSIALPSFNKSQENVLEKEAISNLKFVQEAERLYELEASPYYYPSSGVESDIDSINKYLKLSLPKETNPKWNYRVKDTGCAQATRNIAGGKTFYLTMDDADGEPNSGSGCP